MKSKNKILLYSSLFMFLLSFMACKKQIAIDPPVTELVTANVFNDNGTATAAQLSVYAQMGGAGEDNFYLHLSTGLSADELYTYSTDQTTKNLYTNSLAVPDAANQASLNFWTHFYQYIYQENAVIEGLQLSSKLSPKVKQQLTGEAEFMRAYCYFNLVNLYGDVPLAITTDYKVNGSLTRTPKAQIYQQIIQDLMTAQTNLSPKYVDATDTTVTAEPIRPTVWAADALLARVYLYMGSNYSKQAEDQATNVINNAALFSLPSDLNFVFKKNSTETIWQISNYVYGSSSPYFTWDGVSFILTAPPSSSSINNSSTISAQLMSAFEPGDQRTNKWIGTYTNGASSWNYPAKYKDNNIVASSTSEYTMVLRLAEQFLIRAEARAQQGNTSGALADINIIRNRAGLGNYAGATDQASLISAISHERQVELFAEGDRWFNLKRTGTVDAVMTLVTPQKGGNWNTNQQLYPIPLSELLIDHNLKQNPGY